MADGKFFYGPDGEERPGDFPYTRGIYADMYRHKLWTMRQYAGFGSAEETNARFSYLQEQGSTGLSVAFDLPTQMGYDSDHIMASGEVGRVGVAISSLADMELLLKNIDLGQVSTSMTINATASTLLAMYMAVARKQGVAGEALRGTVQNDILKEYIARGTYIYPPEPSMRLTTDLFAWAGAAIPQWNTISISGYHIREAGSTAAQELAFTLANGIAYVQAAIDAGLDANVFGQRLSFFFNVQQNFFEEIAKFRAARRLWATLMKERFGVTEPRAMMCRFHAQTAGSSLTAQQIENNVVRTALEAASAVLGGAQSLHTNSKDEALALPTEESVRTALRTQQIIAHETGIPEVADPLAGSHYVEALTDRLCDEAQALLTRMDEIGGAVQAIASGYQAEEIARSAFATQQAIDSGEQIVVGVNRFAVDEPPQDGQPLAASKTVEDQLRRLAEVKAGRSRHAVRHALELLERAAADPATNLLPPILECVEIYATLGEIAAALKNVFGEYEPA
ncbi:MAG: methylmalonyl-CoA mutase [Candidatus Marinimicrobia bacterium]|nr:methylmalonyl-CoA mutase [Candidatus Neomarinimicrobiota bacterium]